MIQRRQFTHLLLLGTPGLPWSAAARGAQRAELPDFTALIERLSPAVVAIAGEKQTVGSGFLVRANVVATAAHVVQGAGTPLFVVAGGSRQPARVIATDEAADLALLEVSGPAAPAPLPLAAAARVGEWVVVLGNPFGAGIAATVGIVSAAAGAIVTPALAGKIQINAAVNPGNSGGPDLQPARRGGGRRVLALARRPGPRLCDAGRGARAPAGVAIAVAGRSEDRPLLPSIVGRGFSPAALV